MKEKYDKNAVFIFYSLNNLNYQKVRKSKISTPANYDKTSPCPKCIKISLKVS